MQEYNKTSSFIGINGINKISMTNAIYNDIKYKYDTLFVL